MSASLVGGIDLAVYERQAKRLALGLREIALGYIDACKGHFLGKRYGW
jgi:hypothetical protein